MRWLDGIIDSMDMGFGGLQELVIKVLTREYLVLYILSNIFVFSNSESLTRLLSMVNFS